MQNAGWIFIFREKSRILCRRFIRWEQNFNLRCGRILRRIPYGRTITYGEIAGQLAAQRV